MGSGFVRAYSDALLPDADRYCKIRDLLDISSWGRSDSDSSALQLLPYLINPHPHTGGHHHISIHLAALGPSPHPSATHGFYDNTPSLTPLCCCLTPQRQVIRISAAEGSFASPSSHFLCPDLTDISLQQGLESWPLLVSEAETGCLSWGKIAREGCRCLTGNSSPHP